MAESCSFFCFCVARKKKERQPLFCTSIVKTHLAFISSFILSLFSSFSSWASVKLAFSCWLAKQLFIVPASGAYRSSTTMTTTKRILFCHFLLLLCRHCVKRLCLFLFASTVFCHSAQFAYSSSCRCRIHPSIHLAPLPVCLLLLLLCCYCHCCNCSKFAENSQSLSLSFWCSPGNRCQSHCQAVDNHKLCSAGTSMVLLNVYSLFP